MASQLAAVPAEYALIREVLSNFKCPQDCHLFHASYRMIINCPFGHALTAEHSLKKVPPAACRDFLLGECQEIIINTKVMTLSAVTQNNANSGASNPDILTFDYCDKGIHFRVEQLVDLEHFYEQITAAKLVQITTRDEAMEVAKEPVNSSVSVSQNTAAPALDSDCAICLRPLSGGQPLGMLSECSHVFCADCMIQWCRRLQSSTNNGVNGLKTCPCCRSITSFVLPWSQVITEPAEKQNIVNLQREALNCFSPPQLPLNNVQEVEDQEGEEVAAVIEGAGRNRRRGRATGRGRVRGRGRA